ncbi:uncharacterized protein MONOS_18611 [Monocercomonoides exilis]|uniref:uncharacterized protein n=1 Tax=Monocercomonoides exilis TaxID=2049356 RepID=UPI0035595890|nr:hypothetical protein MONOS_18611 [Monocercomonoides exilis]
MYRNLQISVAIIHQLLYLEKQKMYRANQFIKAFCELSYLNGVEQKQKIEEMNELMDNMTMKEFSSILKIENLDRIIELIDLNTLPMENAFLLLKNMGYWKVSTETWIYDLSVSILFKRFERMIAKEGKKKEGKNEKLLIGLCQCYILLIKDASNELIPIIVPCLLNAALKKEESDEAQKEEEITLLALGNFSRLVKIEKELYLNEIKEIIKNHQKHHNLTRLAYQSAWEFLIGRLPDNSLEDVIANELHFAREAARELEESSSCMDWKNEDAFEEKRISESKKEYHTLKWLSAIDHFFSFCELWNEELSILIGRVSRIFRVTKDNGHHFSEHAIQCLYSAIENSAVGVIDFLKTDQLISF